MARMDNLYNNKIHRLVNSFGKHYFVPNRRTGRELETICKTPITSEMNPTGLSLRAIGAFNYLEEMLDAFIRFRKEGFDNQANTFQLRAHDVTDEFYNIIEKTVKKEAVISHELKAEHKQGMNNTYLTIHEPLDDEMLDVKVPIVYGCDILPRNNLRKLEKETPIVYVITWRETANVLRYATVIDCKTGIGIWSNFFADKLFLKHS